jgi:hypothetical protein
LTFIPYPEYFYPEIEQQAQKNADDALYWKRASNEKEDELQQV